MSAAPRKGKSPRVDSESLGTTYFRIHAWLVDQADYLDAASKRDKSDFPPPSPEVLSLIRSLPDPRRASAIEMRSVMQEVVSGRLEWAYRGPNGSDTNGALATKALDASGGGLSEVEVRQLMTSRLWPYNERKGESKAPPPQQQQQQAVESEQSQLDPWDDLPWDLSPYELSWGARKILDEAAGIATSGTIQTPVSSSIVLFAIGNLGRPGQGGQWVPDFFADYLRSYPRFPGVRDEYLKPRGLRRGQRSRSERATHMSPNVRDILDTAKVMAQRTTGGAVIGGRHLFAALIAESTSSRPPKAPERLAESGIDVDALQRALFEWLRGWGDDDDAWRTLLLDAGPVRRRLTDIHADDTRGPNLLVDIERDVVALGTIIAARSISPPLSIGLFGDWGSGKTFFMRQLKELVGALSREARETPAMQRDLPFYKRIVQIEFNAWHYVEGNLWASLVEHIFDNLHIPEEQRRTKVEDMQLHWIRELGFADAQRKDAQERHDEAARRAEAAQRAVDRAEEDQRARKSELEKLTAKNVIENFELAGAGRTVTELLAPLGLRPATDSSAAIAATIEEARALTRRGASVATALMNAPDRGRRAFWLGVILFGSSIVAAAVGFGLNRLGQEGIAGVSAMVTAVTGWISLGLAWAKRQLGWVRGVIGRVERAASTYDTARREKLAETQAAIESAKQSLAEGQREIVEAKRALDAATQKQKDLEAELAKVTSTNILGQFVQDRAASSDYRQHLGVLALVRNDFEQLSELIEEDNWRLSPGDTPLRTSKTVAGLPAPSRFASLQEENAGADKRINRIVLYIDDLDRCPPAKVVEVLQAVHLLLAFPLFVVVVGVDARWISRSLESRYRELLMGGARDDADDLTHMFGVARSEDYLEKIFQIPLWLRPMSTPDVQRMVRELAKPAAERRSVVGGPATPTPTPPPSAPAPSPDPRDPHEYADHVTDEMMAAHRERVEGPSPEGGSNVEPPAIVANVESLDIAAHELTAISNLAPLLGRSPRALKRFVNLYRLIKAGMPGEEYRAFVKPNDESAAEFENLLFLLAVDTGLPRISREVFDLARMLGAQSSDSAAAMQEIAERINGLADESKPAGQDSEALMQWKLLESWLTMERENPGWVDWSSLDRWVPRVAQFSFQAALERNAPRWVR